jgi:hypothetical protein
MAEFVETLIIGASCYGCGIASHRPDSLILESTIQPGAEFTLTGCPTKNMSAPLKYAESLAIRQELEQRKVIENGFLHNGALAPVFMKWCLKKKLRLRLNAHVIRRNGSKVMVMEADGVREYVAGKIIDAMPEKREVKFLYSYVFGGVPRIYDGIELLETISPEHCLLRQKLSGSTGYVEARQALFEFWRKRPGELREATLMWSSSRFSFDTVDNPVSALDRGMERGEA